MSSVFVQKRGNFLVDVFTELGRSLVDFLVSLPRLLAPFALAWIVSAAVLVLGFKSVKNRVRDRVTRLDNAIRTWAAKLRYRVEHSGMTKQEVQNERIALSWFFRFWTNFASAPSLSFFSLFVPFWMGHLAAFHKDFSVGTPFLQRSGVWLFPGLCYAGSMLMSFVLKRVFKRVRPPRKGFAFGHKLKDPSFPSGHSLTSFCFWMSCAVTVARWSGWNPVFVALFFVIAATIVAFTGLSRVYLGVHFPSDVLGGYFIGLVWCIACFVALSPVLWSH